jgi:hypothetical protein
VAEEHGDVLAVKRAFEDAGFLAGLAERVGESRHGQSERSERGPLAAGQFSENNVALGRGDATRGNERRGRRKLFSLGAEAGGGAAVVAELADGPQGAARDEIALVWPMVVLKTRACLGP